MRLPPREKGFSLIELLLVLAILGIISAIAVPQFMGQRRRARVIGDAQSNARVLAMVLETHKADTGVYGTDATTYKWDSKGTETTGPALLPQFIPKGNSMMNYSLTVNNGGLGYLLTVTDPTISSATVLTEDQTGTIHLDTTYNK